MKNARKREPRKIEGESLTKQSFKDETDINRIWERHMKGGPLGNPGATRKPIFGNFSSVDMMEMRNAIADVDQAFASLPARVRNRFGNDPHQVVRFVENPENAEEAVRLGLLPKPPGTEMPAPKPPQSPPEPVQTDLVEESEKAAEAQPAKEPKKGK